jgi:outer membrane protein assembly factor BamB
MVSQWLYGCERLSLGHRGRGGWNAGHPTALSSLLGRDYRRPRPRAEPVNARMEGSAAAREVYELNADGGIFLSYRREETGHVAGRLADRLIARFGEHTVFMDIDSIPPGADFVEVIQRAVRGCDVLLVLIGPQWTKLVDADGRRRLDDPEDFVVLEVREALDRSVPVVPILVDGALMPRPGDLPPPLHALTRRNAVRVDAESFRSDVSGLLEHLIDMMPGAGPTETATRATDGGSSILSRVSVSRRTALRAAGGAAAAAIALTGVGVWGGRALLLRPPAPVWIFETGGKVYSSPTVVGGLLYIGSSDSNLYALDARTGDERWRYPTGGAVTSSPIVTDGTVYVGSNDSHLHAVDAAAGRRIWVFPTGGSLHSSPVVADKTVYIGSRDNILYALDTRTGEPRWRFKGGDHEDMVVGFNSSPTVVDGVVYIGCRDHNVYAIDAAGGFQRWRRTTNSTVDSSATVSGGTLVIGSDDRNLWALRTADGVPIWLFPTEGGIVSTPRVSERVVYAGSSDGHLYAVDSDTGRQRWRFPTGGMIRSSPAIDSGTVFVGSRDFLLHAVDLATGLQRWSFPTAAPIDDSSPRVVGGLVYIGSLDHRVYAIDAERGAAA